MTLNLAKTVFEFLKQNPEQRFTAREIAAEIFKANPDKCREKQQNSTAKVTPLDTEAALLQQIAAEIGARLPILQKEYAAIKTIEERPRKYYFTESSDSEAVVQAEDHNPALTVKSSKPAVKEQDLYPVLSEFLLSELAIYSKRIDEKKSRGCPR